MTTLCHCDPLRHMKSKYIRVRLEPDNEARVRALAFNEGRSIANATNRLIAAALKLYGEVKAKK